MKGGSYMKHNKYAATAQSSGLGLNMMSNGDMEHMHDAILEVLETIGIKYEDTEALQILADAGAQVDFEAKVAKFPAYMVNDAISSAPGHFYLCGKKPEYDALLGDGRTNWIPFGCGIMVQDMETGEIRESTKQDIINCARLTEALDEYDVCMQTVVAQDVPEHVEELHSFVGHAFHTNKNVTVGPMGKRSAEALVELASIVAGGKEKLQERPFLNFGGCTISPLTIPGSTCQAIIVGAPNNIPIGTLSMAMSGGMSPVKITGSLVVDLAETLGALILAQTVKKGAAMMMGISNGMLDLRHNALAELGCPEAALLSAGFAQMCNFYDVPSLVGGT